MGGDQHNGLPRRPYCAKGNARHGRAFESRRIATARCYETSRRSDQVNNSSNSSDPMGLLK